MRKLLVSTLILATLGATTIALKPTRINAEEFKEKVDNLEHKIALGEEKVSIEEIEQLQAQADRLIKENEPVFGDDVSKVSLYLELLQANKDLEEFAEYIDSVVVEQPMSELDLEDLLND